MFIYLSNYIDTVVGVLHSRHPLQNRGIKSGREKRTKKWQDMEADKVEKLRNWLREIGCIGPITIDELISALQDQGIFSSPRKMMRACGLDPVYWCKKCDKRYVDPGLKESWSHAEAERIENQKVKSKQDVEGKQKAILKTLCTCDTPEVIEVAEKKRRSLPIHYIPCLKTLMWKISNFGFITCEGYYRDRYDEFRAYEDAHHPELTDGHRLSRARRNTVKLFCNDIVRHMEWE